ncbi:MAG: hypothetical protein U1E20_16070 [Methylocystis sp.]|uniref:hypothetical protein n=1 Tax=Methylocystis sp. TaxID=1911079 RepID=UPI00395FBAAB
MSRKYARFGASLVHLPSSASIIHLNNVFVGGCAGFVMRRLTPKLCLILVALTMFIGGRIEFAPVTTTLILKAHHCAGASLGSNESPTNKTKDDCGCSFCQCCDPDSVEFPPLAVGLGAPTRTSARAIPRPPASSKPVTTLAEANRARAPPVIC